LPLFKQLLNYIAIFSEKTFKKIENNVSKFIILDFRDTFDNFVLICKNEKKIFLLLWFMFLPLISLIFTFMFLVGVISFLFLWLTFFWNILLIRMNIKKKKKIKYKIDSTNLSNDYLILFKKLLIQKPRKIAFVYFYKILKLFNNDKKFHFKIDKKFVLYLMYNIFMRFLIVYIFSTPYIVLKMNTYFIFKMSISCDFFYKNFNSYSKFLLFNTIPYINIEIESFLYDLKIFINKKNIHLNPPKINIFEDTLRLIEDIQLMGRSVSLMDKFVFCGRFNLLKYPCIENINFKHSNFDKKFLTPHWGFFIWLNKNEAIMINETTKPQTLTFVEHLNEFKFLPNKFNHQALFGSFKNAWVTHPFKVKREHLDFICDLYDAPKLTYSKDLTRILFSNLFFWSYGDEVWVWQWNEEYSSYFLTKLSHPQLLDEVIKLNFSSNPYMMESIKTLELFFEKNKGLMDKLPLNLQNLAKDRYNIFTHKDLIISANCWSIADKFIV
jgi:hypothetical protein